MERFRIPFVLSLLLLVLGLTIPISVPPEVKISFYEEGRICIETANSNFSILQTNGEISNLSYWCSSGETEKADFNKSNLVFVVSAEQFCLVTDTPVHISYDAGGGITWSEEVESYCFGKLDLSSPVHSDSETSQSGFYY